MGCLLKILFFSIEVIVDDMIEGCFQLMTWIVPQKMRSNTLRIILKVIVSIWTVFLFLTMILGIFAIISSDPETHRYGQYMVFIPLGICAIQIVVGIIVKISIKKK